ncbi:ribonuclease P protein component [Gracilimonas tropica]|uniref:ribonuclease P protein component n=1 Tax=Gracilimonas tropica TaxID=454600 RepID=UPI00038174A0|nr:ribonuclease P protein component [Gracilimonas tropica]
MREKELSNLTGSGSHRFTLPKSHILRGRRNFEELFSSSSLISNKDVNLRFATYPQASRKHLVGFIAPKKTGTAVQRNRTKRLLREAYRLNQHIITELPEIADIGLHYAFLAKRANLSFDSIQPQVIELLTELRQRITANQSPS